MDDLATARAHEYEKTYAQLLDIAARLDAARHMEDNGVDSHATAAMHAIRFAATILWPVVPGSAPPGFPHDSEHLLELISRWREAALELGEFAPARPVLRLVTDRTPPE